VKNWRRMKTGFYVKGLRVQNGVMERWSYGVLKFAFTILQHSNAPIPEKRIIEKSCQKTHPNEFWILGVGFLVNSLTSDL
jgi:hypothetical protein